MQSYSAFTVLAYVRLNVRMTRTLASQAWNEAIGFLLLMPFKEAQNLDGVIGVEAKCDAICLSQF